MSNSDFPFSVPLRKKFRMWMLFAELRIYSLTSVGLSYIFIGIFRAYTENMYLQEFRKITFVS
jgi:hypothetical protein